MLGQVVVCWCVLAGLVALLSPVGARRRWQVISGAVILGLSATATMRLPPGGPAGAVRTLAPALFVLAAYWIAGRLFIEPQPGLERRLLAVDHRAFALLGVDPGRVAGSRWLLEILEASYFTVYAVLPLGAWAAWAQAGPVGVDFYWTVVFPSEATCYIALAWWQTRPPRALEPWAEALRLRSPFRRANELVLTHGSHHMNTIPSGHAAGAVAVALGVASLQVPTAPLFGVVAVAICVATVVGRYHFLVDTLGGAGVALGWWWIVRAVTW
jgi:membrane-associated phospholipid phosphatase